MTKITNSLYSFAFILSLLSIASCSNESEAQSEKFNKVSSTVETSLNNAPVKTAEPLQTDITDHGETTHNNHCYKCHTDEVYKRDNRFVKSIDALSKQVVRCKDGTDAAWFDEDSGAVVQFLNQKYYKF